MKIHKPHLAVKIITLIVGLLIWAFALVWAIHKVTGFDMGSHEVRDIAFLITSVLVFLIAKFQKRKL